MARALYIFLSIVFFFSAEFAVAGCHYYRYIETLWDASTNCTTYGTSWMTSFSSNTLLDTNLHPYAYARDDAAVFVASNGEIRGAFFEQALREERSRRPVDEYEFAAAITAGSP